jgi:hypothetical protein
VTYNRLQAGCYLPIDSIVKEQERGFGSAFVVAIIEIVGFGKQNVKGID